MEVTAPAAAPTRPYFRATTASQREYLFRRAAELGNVSAAARQAHVSRGTWYRWRDRYEAHGVAGLAQERSRAPHRPRIAPVSADLRAEVLAAAQAQPGTGCRTVANRLRQAHNWEPVISHSKVWELTRAATPPVDPAPPTAAAYTPVAAVHAPQPNQTFNVDLCVVPVTHTGDHELAAVSLHAAAAGATPPAVAAAPAAPTWPGQVFADPTQSYPEQMRAYAAQRAVKRASKGQRKHHRRQKQAERAEVHAQRDELRLQRRRVRLARRGEDAAWRTVRQTRQQAEQTWQARAQAERKTHRPAHRAAQARWQAAKTARREQQAQRAAEDAAWRQTRQALREQQVRLDTALPLVTAWIAILVVVDNCTRRGVHLPLFIAGAHVTAEMVVTALRAACPPELQFLISDNGAQFIAEAFAHLAQDLEFLHVRIAPYHACTNGIAERFVRTLKEWLETHPWHSPEELEALLAEFLAYYNDRPHQGAELQGLSPNEYARRLANCSGC
jgi:transposase InsO family protein